MKQNSTRLTPILMLQLAAPQTFAAALCPALYGIYCCYQKALPIRPWMCITLPAAVILLQSAANTLNDYADFQKGTDSKTDALEESDAVLLYSGLSPNAARALGIAYLLLGVFLGLITFLLSGHFIVPLLLGLVGALVVCLYSAGPRPISYLPIGELVSGLTMGLGIPLGITAVMDGRLHPEILPGALPLLLGIALIMLSNNGCDIEKDRAAGRNTWPAVIGREKAAGFFRTGLCIWIGLLIVMPILACGYFGLLELLFLLAARNRISSMWKLELAPETRILQMKDIGVSNFLGNGGYCLVLLFSLLRQ